MPVSVMGVPAPDAALVVSGSAVGAVFEGEPPLKNIYSIYVVNPEKHAGAKADLARQLGHPVGGKVEPARDVDEPSLAQGVRALLGDLEVPVRREDGQPGGAVDRCGQVGGHVQAAALGGNIRVGLEDSLWAGKGKMGRGKGRHGNRGQQQAAPAEEAK